MPIDLNRFKLFAPNKQFEQAVQPIPSYQPKPFMPDENINVGVEEEPMQNQSLQRFLDMAAPERQNPSLLSKIGATMMSLKANPQQVDQALNANYYRDVADHQRNTDNLLKGAAIESQQNNYRSLNDYRNTLGATSQTRAATGQVNAGANVMRAETAKMLAGMPSVRVRLGRGGEPDIFFDGKSGKTLYTSPSGTMDPQLKFQMEQEGRIEIQDMQDDAAMGRTLVTQAGANQRDATANPAQPPSATQRNQEVENRAGELIRQNPDTFGKWIHKNPNTGQWEVDPVQAPGWFGGGNGLTEDVRNQILEYLQTGKPPSQSQGQVPPPSGVELTGKDNPVNHSQIGGTPDGLTGVNTGFGRPTQPTQTTPPVQATPGGGRGGGSGRQSAVPTIMRKTQSHPTKGKRTVISKDGGRTWEVENVPTQR